MPEGKVSSDVSARLSIGKWASGSGRTEPNDHFPTTDPVALPESHCLDCADYLTRPASLPACNHTAPRESLDPTAQQAACFPTPRQPLPGSCPAPPGQPLMAGGPWSAANAGS